MSAVYLSVFVGCTLLSFGLTRGIRNLALSRGWAVAPASARHIHQAPIPRFGGVAIYLAFITVICLAVAVAVRFSYETQLLSKSGLWVLGAATVVFLLGLYDDVRSAPPAVKFLVQGLAAVMLYLGGFGIFQAPLSGAPLMAWLSLPLTILWVIGITNSFNLIDGIDGLAAGSALFSTLAVFIVSLTSGNSYVSMLSLGLAGAILGFLRFNFNPATIFLGDSGSLFIGFMLSALALVGTQKSSTVVAIAIPVVSFGLPILETLISIFRRYLSGQPVFGADREHIHHKLLERGLSQRQSVIILYAVSALCGLLSLLLMNPSGPAVGIVLFVVGAGIWVGVQHLGYHEFVEIRRVAQRTLDQKKVIVNNLAIRRGSEKLAKAKSLKGVCEILGETFQTNDFDGFQLRLNPWVWKGIGINDEAPDDDRNYKWQRTASDVSLDLTRVAVWHLALNLQAGDGQALGDFLVFRACNSNSLLVDINLLTTELRAALGNAIDRLITEAGREITEGPLLMASPYTRASAPLLNK